MTRAGEITVLVVEDEAIVAADIQQMLRKHGYLVPRTAATGPAAIQMADELRPQLVLMDIKLRGAMDGIEAATLIRRRIDVPVVFLTSYSDELTLERAKAAAPIGYIVKPFTERAVRAVVELAAALIEGSVTDALTGVLTRHGFTEPSKR